MKIQSFREFVEQIQEKEDKRYSDAELQKLTGLSAPGKIGNKNKAKAQIESAKGKLDRMEANAPLRYKVALDQYIDTLEKKFKI